MAENITIFKKHYVEEQERACNNLFQLDEDEVKENYSKIALRKWPLLLSLHVC